MSTVEYCGAPYDHSPHTWREGIDETHRCSGENPEETDVDAQDELFERGAY